MKKISYVLSMFMALCNAHAQPVKAFDTYLTHSNQVLYVSTATPDAVQGKMILYERKNNHTAWRKKDSFAVVVGRTGLARDPQSTLLSGNAMPIKKEGDGKSPAGIFQLGNVFSYHRLQHLHMPFVQVDTNFYCVDDATSMYYNSLIVKDTATAAFNSFEYMKRKDNFYEYGVWVLYNSAPVIAGNGSCIFIHIWRDDQHGTAGCTAMAKENIWKLIHWLDRKKKPLLLQVVEGNEKL